MIYPRFLKSGDTIGITALSSGIDPNDLSFDVSLSHLKEEGYNLLEMPCTRSGLVPSADAITRANEFNELMKREDISLIYTASGGEFMMEILPYIDETIIQNIVDSEKTKWVRAQRFIK